MMTFGQIVRAVAPEISSGLDPTSDRAKTLIRHAIGQILEAYPIMLSKKMRIWVCGNIAVFPENVRRVKKYWMNGIVTRPQSINFEFLENGPGLVDVSSVAHNVLTDMGFTPVCYQPSACLPVCLFSDRDDELAQVVIQGLDDNGKVVRSSNGTIGETIQLPAAGVQVISQLSFKTITSVVKTKTNGYVHLYSYDASTGAQFVLGRYEPDTTVAQMRQYRIPGHHYMADGTAQWTEIVAQVLLNKSPLLNDTDMIPVNNMMAIEFMARSIDLHRQHKYKESQVESQMALGIIKQHVMLEYPTDDTMEIQGQGFMFGDVETL